MCSAFPRRAKRVALHSSSVTELRSRNRLLIVVTALWFVCGCGAATPLPPVRHNILLVTIDTLRADRLHRGFTPTLDALAARGVAFANARTVAPLTLPAHVSILTGVLPPAHGVRLNGARFGGVPRSLAERLKEAGYRTGAAVGAFVLDRRFGLAGGFDDYDDRIARDPHAVDRLNAERRAEVVVDAAVAWLQHTDPATPWLLWAHLYDPHAPYDSPDRPAATDSSTSALERAYDGEVAYVDRQLARLLAASERSAAANVNAVPTAIIVTGDHGESLGEHGEATHGMLLFEPALRVPLIVVVPSVAARAVPEAASIIDIMPTVLALAALPRDSSLAGRNLLGALDRDRELYAETEYPTVAGWSPLHALLQDRWKAIVSARAALFDLAGDANERVDVSATRAAVVAKMRGRIEEMRMDAAPAAASATRLSPDAAERLRALGYVSPAPSTASSETDGIDPATVIDQWAAFEHALTALNAGDVAGAVPRLRALALANTRAPIFQSTYARALARAGRHRDALDAYRQAVSRWPADATLYHELAVAAREAGDGDEAMRAEQASLALDGGQAAAHNGLGLLLADVGRHGEAARAFERATRLDPTAASYLANLGNARRAVGDVAGAFEAYRQALGHDPNLADAANGLGVVLVQQQRPVEALSWLERAVRVEPSFVEARLNLGIALQESGALARAAEQYRAVVAAPGSHPRERAAARALLAQIGKR